MQNASDELIPPAVPATEEESNSVAAAFEEAYLRYAPVMQTIAMRRFFIRAADAELLVQEVFTTYLQHASEVEALEKYLIGAICNASYNHLRREAAAKASTCGERSCDATSLDELVDETLERKRIVSHLLSRLDGRDREILQRYYLHGEGPEPIAERMGLPRTTVEKRLVEARQWLLVEMYRAMMERRS